MACILNLNYLHGVLMFLNFYSFITQPGDMNQEFAFRTTPKIPQQPSQGRNSQRCSPRKELFLNCNRWRCWIRPRTLFCAPWVRAPESQAGDFCSMVSSKLLTDDQRNWTPTFLDVTHVCAIDMGASYLYTREYKYKAQHHRYYTGPFPPTLIANVVHSLGSSQCARLMAATSHESRM